MTGEGEKGVKEHCSIGWLMTSTVFRRSRNCLRIMYVRSCVEVRARSDKVTCDVNFL